MSQQFDHFTKTKQQIALMIGQQGMEKLIHNGIYSFTVGGNDYINNYMALTTNTKNMYTLPQYLDRLITLFRGQLKVQYSTTFNHLIFTVFKYHVEDSIVAYETKNLSCRNDNLLADSIWSGDEKIHYFQHGSHRLRTFCALHKKQEWGVRPRGERLRHQLQQCLEAHVGERSN